MRNPTALTFIGTLLKFQDFDKLNPEIGTRKKGEIPGFQDIGVGAGKFLGVRRIFA